MFSRLAILASVMLVHAVLIAQVERSGTPVSWTLHNTFGSFPMDWEIIPEPDWNQIAQEDGLQDSEKSAPFRFAYASPVSYDTRSYGRWTNLANGDRIWTMGIFCGEDALSVSLTFSEFELPLGARIYVYSDDHTDFVGPFTSRDNREGELTTPHVAGGKVVVEYYEPRAFRGRGRFNISHVSEAYRRLDQSDLQGNFECFHLLDEELSNVRVNDASSAVLMMISDRGQKVSTGVLMNNTSYDASPYVLTAKSALVGDPSGVVFQFNVAGKDCFRSNSTCNTDAICGARRVVTDPIHGLVLLELLDKPVNSWEAYYSGWQLETNGGFQGFKCIQQSLGIAQSLCTYTGNPVNLGYGSYDAWSLEQILIGGTFSGSVGSPLFDHEMNLVGIYLGGDSGCDGEGRDYFSMMYDAWNYFKSYLDPMETAEGKLPGIYPRITDESASETTELISFFPNPAKEWIYIQNESGETINQVVFWDASGRMVSAYSPNSPTVSLNHLPEGLYMVEFITSQGSVFQKLLIR